MSQLEVFGVECVRLATSQGKATMTAAVRLGFLAIQQDQCGELNLDRFRGGPYNRLYCIQKEQDRQNTTRSVTT